MNTVRTCSRCVIDETVPGAAFDERGVCSYCAIHDALDAAYPLGAEGAKRLEALAERIKRDGKGKNYDCVVGVSGGTDSTYLLLLAVRLGLRPLAVHFDNGWNSEIAVSNIKKTISKLGVDLQTYVVDWEEFKDILKAHLRASIPWADLPTDIGLSAALYRTAAAEGVRHILVGNNFRSEGKQPTEWTYGDGRSIAHIVKRFGSHRLKTFPNLTLFDVFHYAFIRRIKLVRPLYHLDFDKPKAKLEIARELGWEDYGGHHYESIFTRFVYSYYLVRKFGVDKRIISLSAQVRSGVLDRERALAELAAPPLPEERAREDVRYVMKKLGLSQAEFDEIMTAPPRSFRDYPSYYPLISRFTGIARRAVKLLLPWTPMIFYEIEARGGISSRREKREKGI